MGTVRLNLNFFFLKNTRLLLAVGFNSAVSLQA